MRGDYELQSSTFPYRVQLITPTTVAVVHQVTLVPVKAEDKLSGEEGEAQWQRLEALAIAKSNEARTTALRVAASNGNCQGEGGISPEDFAAGATIPPLAAAEVKLADQIQTGNNLRREGIYPAYGNSTGR